MDGINLEDLRAELRRSGASWQMTTDNPILAKSAEERRNLLGVTPPPGEPSLEEAAAADAARALPTVTPEIAASETVGAPASFDHRNVAGKNFTTSVKNQGSCGTCVSHGVTAAMETSHQRATGRTNTGLDLSEAHLHYCHGGKTCPQGWWPNQALEQVKTKRVATEDKFPYGSATTCAVASGWESSSATVGSYTKLTTRAAMKNWIATKGSIVGCFYVYSDFYAYQSGVYRHVSGDLEGGHCVEIVGYNDSLAAWICKNSWGSGWGENGYFCIGYGQVGIESYGGPYGVSGVSVRQWVNDRKVTGVWSNGSDKNAWAHLSGHDWVRLTTTSQPQQHAMLTEVLGAKAGSRNVRVLVDGREAKELYVL